MTEQMSISDMIGTKPVKCDDAHTFFSVTFCFPAEGNGTDWAYCVKKFNLADDVTSIRLCWACAESVPSNIARANKSREVQKTRREASEAERQAKIEWAIDNNQDLYKCLDCNALYDDEETITVRYCTFCESTFDGSQGRNCETCNRPFTRKCTSRGCIECLDEDNELELQHIS